MGNWELGIENWGLRIDVILIGSVKILDGGLTFGGDTFAFEDLEDGQEEDLEIEGEGQMVNIIDIQLEFFGPRDGVTAIDLSPAAEAGTDFMTPHLFFAIEGEIADQQGTGTNESHIALKDIKELGKLVDGKGPTILPTFVSRNSSGRGTPSASHSSVIVLNLITLKIFPFNPGRSCVKKAPAPLLAKWRKTATMTISHPMSNRANRAPLKLRQRLIKCLYIVLLN